MLEVQRATLGYGARAAVTGCSLSVAPGELVALVGENGCGKSTLARAMCAVQLVDEGRVVVDGHDPSVSELERLHVREVVGYVQQDPRNQLVCALVYDEVAFVPRNMGLDEETVAGHVRAALSTVGLSGYERRETARLSGGEQQRVAMAGALAMEPRYVVLDEPTAQLDPLARAHMRALFAMLAHERGIGVVLVTHDAREIALADRVVSLGDASAAVPSGDDAGETCGGAGEFRAVSGTARASAQLQAAAVPVDASPVLELRGVSCGYGDRRVLADVSLTVRAGEIVLLAGASGAGKTTLALVAAGLLAPQAGAVRVAGAPVRPGMVGLAFQNPESQIFLDTVFDEIAYAPRNAGVGEEGVAKLVRAAAQRVGLTDALMGCHPMELSGGQMRRVGLAATLALDAPVYILDEPSAALDAAGRADAHRLVCGLAAAGKAVVVISHDVEEWASVVHRSVCVRDGAVHPYDVDAGTPASGHASPVPEQVPVGASQGLASSPLARLDARVRIALLAVLCAALFAASTPVTLLPWFAVLAAGLVAARMSVREVARGLKPIALVLLVMLAANAIVVDGHADIPLVGPVGIVLDGVVRGAVAMMRIVLLVGFARVAAATTTAPQVADACVRMLRPLASLGVPVGALGSTLMLALHFMPLVGEELGRIRLSQRARGARFDEGPLLQRIRVWTSVFIPLIVGLFHRADCLAEAMAARLAEAPSAQRLPEPRSLARRDWVVLVLGGCIAILLAALGMVPRIC